MTLPASTARTIAEAFASGRTSAETTVRAALRHAAEVHERTGALPHRHEEAALADARAWDQRRDAGEPLPPLAGVPLVVKANISVQDLPTDAASAMLRDYRPAGDATVVARLRRAGMIVIASANMDEFGMGGSSERSVHGPVRHPERPELVAGGSSGGSAVAVATGVVPLALGTDTGGSVRQPAAFCSVLGMKPSYGTLSRAGVIAYGSSLDQVGLLARDEGDMALALSLAAGPDPADATSREAPAGLNDPLPTQVEGLRLALLAPLLGGADAEVAEAVRSVARWARSAGAEVSECDLPGAEAAVAAYHLIAATEAASNLSRFDGLLLGARVGAEEDGQEEVATASRSAGFGAEVRRRILMGTFAASAGHVDAWFLAAARVRRLLTDRLSERLAQADLLLAPTAPTPPYQAGERLADPLAMALGDACTCLANLAGLPAISVPAGRSADGRPLAVQAIAATKGEATLLRFAAALRHGRGPVLSSSG